MTYGRPWCIVTALKSRTMSILIIAVQIVYYSHLRIVYTTIVGKSHRYTVPARNLPSVHLTCPAVVVPNEHVFHPDAETSKRPV
jgi:hypothetical protein